MKTTRPMFLPIFIILGAGLLAGAACSKDPPSLATGSGGSGSTSAAGTGGSSGTVVVPDNKLALTPPMGWNSWNKFTSGVSDTVVRQTADALVATGMAAAGYQYVVIDDTWQAAARDANGALAPDPGTNAAAPRFADMKALADYVHSKGLKFGIYSDRGTTTCAGRPGSYGHETQDAQTFAAWGVDYLKYDNCNASASSAGIEQDFRAMGGALAATGRDIVYSISAWWFYDWEPAVGNLWRTTTDIKDNWTSMISLADRNGGDTTRYGSCTTCPTASAGMCVVCDATMPEAAYSAPGITTFAKPGHWNDPDMLEVGNGGMTDTEDRTHFSLWAMMAAPLIAGNDITKLVVGAPALDTLTNAEVIAVDQDPLGVQGKPVSASTTLEVWSKPLSGTGTYAVLLLNRTDAAADITVPWSMIGITSGSASVRDLWAKQDLGVVATQYTAAAVPSHGVVMLKVTAH